MFMVDAILADEAHFNEQFIFIYKTQSIHKFRLKIRLETVFC